MHTSAFLLTLAVPAVLAAHIAPRQDLSAPAAPAPAPTAAPAPQPPVPAPTGEAHDHETMDHPNTNKPPTPTTKPNTGYSDLAKCELAIDTLLRAFNMVPTPNAALSSFLAVETAAVTDPCQWASDVPENLRGAYSAYSQDFVSMLSQHEDLVTQLESCVDAGGASVTRAEIVTPLFALPDCKEASTTSSSSGATAAGGNAQTTTTTRGFPTGTSSAGVAATGAAMVGVAAAALLGVAGAL